MGVTSDSGEPGPGWAGPTRWALLSEGGETFGGRLISGAQGDPHDYVNHGGETYRESAEPLPTGEPERAV